MTMKRRLIAFILAFASGFAPAPGFAQVSTTAIEEVATAGPFVANSKHMQRFFGQFKLDAADVMKPLTLIIHNGVGGTAGFNWIRVLIGGDMNVSNLKGAEEPTADLVFDESYIERHTVNVDLSGKVFQGINTLILEGTAPKGAVMSWVLQGPLTPEFAGINPTTARAGGRLTLSGKGFSLDPSENHVSIGGRDAQLLYASRNSLTVKVPDHIGNGEAEVVVTTNNVRSAPYAISIEKPIEAAPVPDSR
ncbi:IPT/TIG domain-containing protein [Candidatus Obscuribacterales bacterium]|nr:IPT/TIG domain-containing protein [Candidatus Obscuribacterales bacterium]